MKYKVETNEQALAYIMDKMDNMSKRMDCIFATVFIIVLFIVSVLLGIYHV